MERIKLFLKGVCMGVSDIIPGVSGGTMALILGVYAELVNSIKELHLRWVPAVWQWIRGGFQAEDREEIAEQFRSMNIPFLIVLGCGIVTAVAIGGMVLPGLIERHPEAMRALFFGLIVASVWIPLEMVSPTDSKTKWWVAGAIVLGVAAGWMATGPGQTYQAGTSWVEIEAGQGDTLEDVNRRGPAAWSAERIYHAERNAPLRRAVQQTTGATELEQLEQTDAAGHERLDELYGSLEVPEGTTVHVPRLAIWYVFAAGVIAICAMILPGISGAYILLILGAYFFVLNSLRGTLTGLTSLSLPVDSMMFVAAFSAGALVGILSFARLMSYLLGEFRSVTLGVLVGLMVGCLRGIWPFQQTVDGHMVNVMPDTFDATVLTAMAAAVAGAVLVMVLSRLGGCQSTEPER